MGKYNSNRDMSYDKLIRKFYGGLRDNNTFQKKYDTALESILIFSPLSMIFSRYYLDDSGDKSMTNLIALWKQTTNKNINAYSLYVGRTSYFLNLTNRSKGQGNSVRREAKLFVFILFSTFFR